MSSVQQAYCKVIKHKNFVCALTKLQSGGDNV